MASVSLFVFPEVCLALRKRERPELETKVFSASVEMTKKPRVQHIMQFSGHISIRECFFVQAGKDQ